MRENFAVVFVTKLCKTINSIKLIETLSHGNEPTMQHV